MSGLVGKVRGHLACAPAPDCANSLLTKRKPFHFVSKFFILTDFKGTALFMDY